MDYLPKLKATTRGQGLGEDALYWNSVHCGAQVLEGEKWFANLWLRWYPKGKAGAGGLEL
jgi:hypothetical protein